MKQGSFPKLPPDEEIRSSDIPSSLSSMVGSFSSDDFALRKEDCTDASCSGQVTDDLCSNRSHFLICIRDLFTSLFRGLFEKLPSAGKEA